MLRICVHVCACVYGQYDRCWIAIVMNFTAYTATGGWHRLLAGCSCKAREDWNGGCTTKVWSHDEGRDSTGDQGSVTGVENKSVTGDMVKQVGTEV